MIVGEGEETQSWTSFVVAAAAPPFPSPAS